MRRYRLWAAMLGALLMPWVGPHMNRYLPLGWVLLQVPREHPDAGFWVIAGALFVGGYAVSLGLLFIGSAAWRRGARVSGRADA